MGSRRRLALTGALALGAAFILGGLHLSAGSAAADEPSPSPSASPTGDTPVPGPTEPSSLPESPAARPTPVAPRPGVYAIGDSVMLGARSCLELRGYDVNALGSRRPSAVLAELASRRHRLPADVVVHTGTNGGATVPDLARIVRAIGPAHEVVLVTVQLPENGRYSFELRTNIAIRTVARMFPNVHVADWNSWSNVHPGLTYGDGIHLPPAGCRAFAYVVASTLRSLRPAQEASRSAEAGLG